MEEKNGADFLSVLHMLFCAVSVMVRISLLGYSAAAVWAAAEMAVLGKTEPNGRDGIIYAFMLAAFSAASVFIETRMPRTRLAADAVIAAMYVASDAALLATGLMERPAAGQCLFEAAFLLVWVVWVVHGRMAEGGTEDDEGKGLSASSMNGTDEQKGET